jgi:hypothetical protein
MTVKTKLCAVRYEMGMSPNVQPKKELEGRGSIMKIFGAGKDVDLNEVVKYGTN